MPHAALLVVQGEELPTTTTRYKVSMPHAALFVVQGTHRQASDHRRRFNAARGFVCGASRRLLSLVTLITSFNAARGFVCGARAERARMEAHSLFQCRTRLCLWCKNILKTKVDDYKGFNAARGFVCGARRS